MIPPRALFGISVVLSFAVWGVVAALYVWPALPDLPLVRALRPILLFARLPIRRPGVPGARRRVPGVAGRVRAPRGVRRHRYGGPRVARVGNVTRQAGARPDLGV